MTEFFFLISFSPQHLHSFFLKFSFCEKSIKLLKLSHCTYSFCRCSFTCEFFKNRFPHMSKAYRVTIAKDLKHKDIQNVNNNTFYFQFISINVIHDTNNVFEFIQNYIRCVIKPNITLGQ